MWSTIWTLSVTLLLVSVAVAERSVLSGVLGDVAAHRSALQDVLSAGWPELAEHLQLPVGMDGCTNCKTGVLSVRSAIRLGLDFEALRLPAVAICKTVMADVYDVDELCPGVITNWGPHVFNIVDWSNDTAQVICTKLNECQPPPATTNRNSVGVGRAPRRDDGVADHRGPSRSNGEQPIRVAHMTDVHTDLHYEVGSPSQCRLPSCCHDSFNGTGSARFWGEFSCNNPARTTRLLFGRIAQLQPDMILASGDNPPHTVWLESLWGQLNATRFVTESLRELVPGVRVYPALGNHECFPTNMYHTDLEEVALLNRMYGEWFTELAGFEEQQLADIETAGFYSLLHRPGLRILSYNSNYGYTDNWYLIFNEYRPELLRMKNWMRATLLSARQLGEKVIMIGHHYASHDGELDWSRFISGLCVEFSDLVVLHVAGHTHSVQFRLFRDELGDTVGVQHTGGSVNTRTDNNPGFRIYELDPVTFQLIDYEQYGIEIDSIEDGDTSEPEVKHMYTMTSHYDMADLSPDSYFRLTERFELDETNQIFLKYYRWKWLMAKPEVECEGSCKEKEICRLRSTTREQYDTCLGQGRGQGQQPRNT